ncbi:MULTISPECIES: uracil-DNA glycosylase family protein [unclassified Treponema]|uniref:uracil-DNA glycosylase n=1 Tax=unclassified Treponema TaxID=2638727 RepID=UPI0020A353CF|nr:MULTISPECIES: uracil-DNA glycosylase [unclassified Treponema]UTC67408.1 uracil-DNA glycosylase [Treponema sp. OMZ 789]UTC70136.1 uracil-DNA glycosylase [Treponema sp. OMZ 790]UTC72851.1 uracil-DNA glycosylase [Treponema sp. OMZ 791]
MKAEEKKILYTFFRTASECLSGFKTDEEYPDFSDDSISVNPESRNAAIADMDIADSAKNLLPNFENGFESLEKVYARIASCKACRLCERRHNIVAGEGPREFSNTEGRIDVMVIGEGPGADEDAQGRPFVGKAGQLLDKMLAAIELFRTHNCYITNVVKCRPPNNRDPLPDETAACRNYLNAQITLIRPKAILVVGRVALQNLLETQEGIGKMHGKFFEYQNIPLMATYHPSALLRDVNLKRPAWEDLKLFRARLNELLEKN